MTFSEAVRYVSSLQSRGWRLGLDRMELFLKSAGLASFLGGPGSPIRYIHVAGTNGKGSVTAFIQSILIEQGWKTGSAFSPYVFNLRERVQMGTALIPEEAFASHTTKLKAASAWLEDSELGGLTEFEFKTALGFSYWAEQNAEWVALEVGLGGRLDATNVVTPAASVIVSIGLDHTNILGSTYAEISREKAGIIKPGRPVIVGDLPLEALGVIEKVANENQSLLWRFGHEINLEQQGDSWCVTTPNNSYSGLNPQLMGLEQPHNMALAIAACEAAGAIRNPEAIQEGVRKAWQPGRFQWVSFKKHTLLLDGAHNAEAAKVLVKTLKDYLGDYEQIVLLTGMVQGHNPRDFFNELKELPLTSIHIVPINFHRAYTPQELSENIGPYFLKTSIYQSIEKGLEAALFDAGERGLILVTGSFYLLGELHSIIKS